MACATQHDACVRHLMTAWRQRAFVFLFWKQWRLVWRQCGIAAPPIFTVKFVFRSGYCFTLIFIFALTGRVDNVFSLSKSFCKKLNIKHLFGFVWEALQITKVWSCERLQGRCRYSMEGLWPVSQAQPAWNCELELGFPQCRPGKW